jgi:microcystin-dependent protein
MAILSRGQSFASGDQVTAQKLQDIVDLATFDDPADESTIVKDPGTGKLKVPSNGIGSNELASDASTDANRAVDTDHIKDGSVTAAKLNSAAVSVLMPTGTILPYAGSSAPTGYLFCDGNEYDQTGTHSSLFSTIGLTYNTGGETTNFFRVPDLQGRVIAGRDNMSGTSANRLTNPSSTINGINGDILGNTGGSEEHLLTAAQSGLRSHNHSISSSTLTGSGGPDPRVSSVGSNTGAANNITSSGTDASSAHNNVQPTIILNYIIKT